MALGVRRPLGEAAGLKAAGRSVTGEDNNPPADRRHRSQRRVTSQRAPTPG